jgi:hypothetical protein
MLGSRNDTRRAGHHLPPLLPRTGLADVPGRFGTTPDGRIFQTARGGTLQDSGYSEVWDQARKEALTPAQYKSTLGRCLTTCGTPQSRSC